MDRRRFTQLSAASLVGLRTGGLLAQATPKPLRYAVVGLGTISDIFIRACAQSTSAKVTALVTGHPEGKAPGYAAQYGIPASSIYTYETYDRLRDNHDVDAVYIGLPNSMHREYTVRAAAAGKHVLCEKPMAISSAECREMIAACRKANVKLMIAYRVHYDPLWNEVRKRVQGGELGQIEAFQGAFPGYEPPGAWRLNRALAGGGSLLDLGIYPLNAIRELTAEEPNAFTAVVSTRDQDGRFKEVEQSIEWTMKFPSGIISSCSCSYGQSGQNFLIVRGENGWLEVSPAYNYDGLKLRGQIAGQPVSKEATQKAPYQFTLEADYFAGCVRENREPETNGEEGLKDLIAMEAIYRAAGTPIA